MGPPFRSTHAILPRDDRTNPAKDGTQAKMDGVTLAHPIHGEPAKKRRRYNSRKTPAEWDLIKADLKKLYVDEDRSLEETIAELQASHGFEASKDQFKSKIKVWDFDKKVKTQEMKHIVRIDKKRLPKKTSFTVRKQPVSRFKIERFKKGHSAFPEPPSRTPSAIGYRTSCSPPGTPSLNLTVSPRLEILDWYGSCKEYRNQAPEYSLHPAFEILQKLQIQEDTWQLRMFSKSQFLGLTMLLKDASAVYSLDSNKDCLGCVLRVIKAVYSFGRAAHENDPDSLPAKPNLRRWVSEVSSIFQSKAETLGIPIISQALKWSLSEGIAIAVNVFYEAALELCRGEELKNWYTMLITLHTVDHLILGGRLPAAETLLRAIIKRDFDFIFVPSWNSWDSDWDPVSDDEPRASVEKDSDIIDVPSWNCDWEPVWDDEPMQSLYWRRAITQLVIIRWFLARPGIEHEVFCNYGIPRYSSTTFGGLHINHTYFSLAGLCPGHSEYFSHDENFTEEDKVARDLIEGIGFSKADRLRMRTLLGLSRYLPRYGHFMRISAVCQALDSEKQEEAGKEDEKGIKDQDGISFTGLQFGEHLRDREQEE